MSRSIDLRTAKMRSAFTLIELLVVIAIIAILAAILFPVFAQAKEAAKKTADLSNQKQILLGEQMYMADYDDVYAMIRNGATMTACYTNLNCDQVFGFEDMVMPYIKNRDLFKSPNDSIPRDDCAPFNQGGVWYPISYSVTYFENLYAGGIYTDINTFGVHGLGTQPSLTASAVGAPAATIIQYPLYSTSNYGRWYMHYRWDSTNLRTLQVWPNYNTYTKCGLTAKLAIGGYSGITNWGFGDGHAKAMKQNQIMVLPWNATAIANKSKNLVHFNEEFK